MKCIALPAGQPLAWYLDQEIRLAETATEDLFFCWRVKPTVIFGRHQQREAEVNEAYCLEHGIDVVQRKSGGGCVYADEGNLMISLISTDTHSEAVFERFLKQVAHVLQSLGLEKLLNLFHSITKARAI